MLDNVGRKRLAEQLQQYHKSGTHSSLKPGIPRHEQVQSKSDCIDTSSIVPADRSEHKYQHFIPTIGIVTALECEYQAMSFMLDSPPEAYNGTQPQGDPNKYKLGKIGGKHVVLVEVGEAIAAVTVCRLCDVFDTINIVFMVGVAGGVPNPDYDESEAMETTAYIRPHVRKGDVIVSYPIQNDGPAFVQYDYGKLVSKVASENFKENIKHKHFINLHPKALSAARELKQNPEIGNTLIDLINKQITKENQLKFRRPGDDEDILSGGKQHPVEPMLRNPGVPKVHFGIMASANSVMRSAEIRDKLAEAEHVIGFEMENSGVASATSISSKGCMFVRGVCDYADEEKDKRWQPYASLLAAATATYIIAEIK
ncbi:uncharacterized protein LOC144343189 [Saccoglossus kowalevskii]